MEENLSQQTAKGFEKINYFLFPVSLLAVLIGTFPMGVARTLENTSKMDFENLSYLLIIWGVFVWGNLLFAGYYLHSRDRLNKRSVIVLWSGTVLLNFLFFCVSLLFIFNPLSWLAIIAYFAALYYSVEALFYVIYETR